MPKHSNSHSYYLNWPMQQPRRGDRKFSTPFPEGSAQDCEVSQQILLQHGAVPSQLSDSKRLARKSKDSGNSKSKLCTTNRSRSRLSSRAVSVMPPAATFRQKRSRFDATLTEITGEKRRTPLPLSQNKLSRIRGSRFARKIQPAIPAIHQGGQIPMRAPKSFCRPRMRAAFRTVSKPSLRNLA